MPRLKKIAVVISGEGMIRMDKPRWQDEMLASLKGLTGLDGCRIKFVLDSMEDVTDVEGSQGLARMIMEGATVQR